MITAREANYIAKYGNPQKELVELGTQQLIDYINKATILAARKGLFEFSITFTPRDKYFSLSEPLTDRSFKETLEKVADILENQGFEFYYEKDYVKWSWDLDE